jgi:putative transposase
VVQDLPRSGAPERITVAQKQQIVSIACEKPDTYGIEMTDWTHEMLVKVVMAQGIVDTISRRHLGGILKNERVTTA